MQTNPVKASETIRKALIAWNVAPLTVVAILVAALRYETISYHHSACELSQWAITGHFSYVAVICGLLFKAYEYMQKDRGAK